MTDTLAPAFGIRPATRPQAAPDRLGLLAVLAAAAALLAAGVAAALLDGPVDAAYPALPAPLAVTGRSSVEPVPAPVSGGFQPARPRVGRSGS